MSLDILVLINGLGLGNSTRCHAVIQKLASYGAQVSVLTSGNGAWYFGRIPDIVQLDEIEPFFYGKKNGNLSILATLNSLQELFAIRRRNTQKLEAILDKFNFSLVVSDSMYILSPIRHRGIPIVALNNADVVCRAYSRFNDKPTSITAQFYTVEFADYLFHKWIPNIVLSPTLIPNLGKSDNKIFSIPPIVRSGYERSVFDNQQKRVVIMLSGSTFGTHINIQREDTSFRLDIIGREAPPGWQSRQNVRYWGRIRDTLPFLQGADLVVVNGGFSAVSEAFAMAIPMIVVPVPNHAEQWLNARTIQHLGVGFSANESEIEQRIIDALQRLPEFRKAYDCIHWHADGATQAADKIIEFSKMYP